MILNCRYHVYRIITSDISLKTRCFGLHFCCRMLTFIFNHFGAMRPGSCQVRWNNGKYGPFRHSRWPILVPIESTYTTSYYWLILTYLLSCTVLEIQHSKCQKLLYLATPLAFKPPDGGFPGTITVKLSVDVNGWPRYQMAKKNCRKFQPVE